MVEVAMKINLSQDSCVTSSDEACDLKEQPRNKTMGSEAVVSQSSNVVKAMPPPLQTQVPAQQSPIKPQNTTCKNECIVPKSFPWIVEFNRICRAEIGNSNIHVLEKLMTIYLRVVASSVTACYKKPIRATKLKIYMNDTLMLFHLFYSDIKKPFEHSSYLDKMSDLMAMYIDVEITASRRRKETLRKIASKLTSSLYIYLDHSQDHILDSLFKTKCMNKNNGELCNMIFSRVLRESPGRNVYEMTYVRHVLAFKMWKRLFDGAEEKRNVTKLATMRLIPPSQFREKVRAGLLREVLPKIPKSRDDVTLFLMQAKVSIKEKTKAFLKAVSDPKQQGVLSTLLQDFNPSLFYVNADGSPPSSSLSLGDDNEEPTQSSYVSDLWSMDSSGNDRIKKKTIKSKINKKAKCKGIATPVFMKDTTLETKNDKELKKKKPEEKPKKHADAINAVKPLPAVSQSCDDPNSEDDVVTKECGPETPIVSQSCLPDPVKSEPSENDCVEVKREVEQVNLVDSPTDEGVAPTQDGPLTKRLKTEENESSKSLSLQLPAEQLDSRDDKQQLIKQITESLEKQGRFPKSQGKTPKVPTTDAAGPAPHPPARPKPERTSMLHNSTLRRDFSTFISQQKFRSHCLIHNEPPSSPVPSPYDGDDANEARCNCAQCCANQGALVTNHRILTQYRDDHIRDSSRGGERVKATDVAETVGTGIVSDSADLGLRSDAGLCVEALGSSADIASPAVPEQPFCLPLKKRKTAAAVDGGEVCYPATPMMCYPSTPMISIAELEETSRLTLAVHNLHSYSMPHVPPEAPASAVAIPPPPSTPPPPNPITPLPPVPKFKTPAQLKEGSAKSSRHSNSDHHHRPAKEIAAAQSLINFGKDSQDFSKPSSRSERVKNPRYSTRSSEKSHSRRKKS